jgi:hypothetical protein
MAIFLLIFKEDTKSRLPNVFSYPLLYLFLVMLSVLVAPKILVRMFLSKPVTFLLYPSLKTICKNGSDQVLYILFSFLDVDFLKEEGSK